MFRSCSVLPLVLFPLVTALAPAQVSIANPISTHAFLGATVTAYGGYMSPTTKGSLQVAPRFLANPAVEALAYASLPTGGGRAATPSCNTRIRMNGTTRASAYQSGLSILGSPPFSCSLNSLATVTNVLPGAGAQRTLTFGSTQITLATNCGASASVSADFVLGSVPQLDNTVMQLWATGATTVLWNGGISGTGILSQLNYGTHSARVDDVHLQYGNTTLQGTLSWSCGAASLLEALFVPGFATQTVETQRAAIAGSYTWQQPTEG